uniref:endoplasmic reticulum metallopeptidase 1 isoform X7 n=1 Tax=Pristiophorus japonicus TaxID=55135 RepID=UPI00398F671D
MAAVAKDRPEPEPELEPEPGRGVRIRGFKERLKRAKSRAEAQPQPPPPPPSSEGRDVAKARGEVPEAAAVLLAAAHLLLLWALIQLSLRQLLLLGPAGPGAEQAGFSAHTARKHLQHITDFGPRPAGSPANEILTVNYLLKQIQKIQEGSAAAHSIAVDIQRPSGSFSIDFLGGFSSYYHNITNIVVKLEPKDGAKHAVLANCHFDSVANSPGASDDAVSCAVMLEVLNALSKSSTPLQHAVIFVFNGAEENILQASHGFITQHPWAKLIRAFINLEAAGVGGKELVFQSGPENPWLVQAYVRAAKHPFASVVGQEVFQSGVIPSDTDFRIYRDYGNIPGLQSAPPACEASLSTSAPKGLWDPLGLQGMSPLVATQGIDLAFIENGYIYHTKYDTADRIPLDSIKRAGDNILAVLQYLATSVELADSTQYRHGTMVFFDVLGLFVVAYPQRIGVIINYLVAVAAVLHLGKKFSTSINHGSHYMRDLLYGIGVTIICWFIIFVTILIVAVFVSLTGHAMSWYTHFYVSIVLYGSIALAKLILIHTLAKNLYYGNMNAFYLAELYFDVSLTIWCCTLVYLTQRGLCSAYVPGLWVAFPLVVRLLIGTELKQKATLVCSGAFFPYASDPAGPHPKRISLQHTTRTFHDLNGEIIKRDSGIWINGFDYTLMSHVTPHIPEINHTIRSSCENAPFCGFPWFLPINNFIRKNWYLPASEISPKTPVAFKLISKYKMPLQSMKLTFELTGPSHMTLYIRPLEGSFIIGSSIGDGTSLYSSDGDYFVFYSHGLQAPPWQFWLEIQTLEPTPDAMVTIAVASHYLFGEDQRTADLIALEKRFPEWCVISSWSSSYNLFVF